MVPETDNRRTAIELALIEATKAKDAAKVEHIIDDNPDLNIDCTDKDEFTPLQHACHSGDLEVVRLLLLKGAKINHTARKDRYTPLMLAALGNKVDVVKLLLEKGANKRELNSVNRTAADMAGFVGLGRIANLINCYLKYEDTIEPFTRCLELEDKPRLESHQLGRKLHEMILLPSLHPIRLLYYVLENSEIMRCIQPCIFVMEKLSGIYLRSKHNDDTISFKFHYLAELLNTCKSLYENSAEFKASQEFNDKDFESFLMKYLRRLNSRKTTSETIYTKPVLNELVMKCMLSYPHNTATNQSLRFALSKLSLMKPEQESGFDAMLILAQTLNGAGSMSFGAHYEDCEVCREKENNKKCTLCKKAYYCGPFCQKVDWPRHKKECKTS